MANILVTGGAGFIGSHTCIELLKADHTVVIVDNLSNSKKASIDTVERLTAKKVTFYNEDICNEQALENIFSKEQIDSVIHFAGLKSVGESSEKPLSYYENNVVGTLTLLKVMTKYNCRNLIFSSSATVYGNPEKVPIKEEFPLSVTNPYGRTKLILEDILKDIFTADHSWKIIVLRYFNPIGAHESGDLGEDPFGIPNNLLPYVTQVAIGKLAYVNVFGSDYPTKDGTGVRDYIHVVDLARGHVAALSQMIKPGIFRVYNLGTGKGYSVLDIIKTMSDVIGKDIPYKISKRRPGDIAICYADPSKANLELGWQARYDIKQMCQDAWRWQKKHPNGFDV
ncbi:UDP-glucose 4-epimerase GalE [Streptococcus phocae]|uniref:UDP-glucose 4-epimerase n=1 Tax=Streptococcus phocae TaxID=119224 RepID=A0A0P6SQU8_9STRE|nr:UDP-galactose-4-epimerase [Streptococcus phocae]